MESCSCCGSVRPTETKPGFALLYLREEEIRLGMELLFFGYRGFTSGPDVVLAVTMPGADGLSLAESLHKTNNVPIMLLTARGAPEDRIAGFEAGADDYLPKPFDPREPRYLQTVRGIGYMLRPGG